MSVILVSPLSTRYPVLKPINIWCSGEQGWAPPGNIFTTLQLLLSWRRLYRIEVVWAG